MNDPLQPVERSLTGTPGVIDQPRAATPVKLLLIEDSAFDAAMIVRLLARHGYVVDMLRVEDAAGLRAALDNGPWDAIISDHVLPGFSAIEALAIYRAARLEAPFIIVSGQIGEDVAVAALHAGADDYILKSNLGRLVPALRRGLQAAEARRTRHIAERARRISEARLRGIASNLPGVVFQLEQGSRRVPWRLRYISERAKDFFGIEPDLMLAEPTHLMKRIGPGDLTRLVQALRRGARDLASVSWDAKLLPRDGDQGIHVAVVCAPRRQRNGAVIWEGVMIDISAQKAAEQALAQSRANLRDLTLHLETVREEQRKAIAREIHDDIGGVLTGLRFEVAALRAALGPEHAGRVEAMGTLLDMARQASDRIMHNLRPSVLDHGIVAALDWLARLFTETYGIPCTFRTNQPHVPLSENRSTTIFRIAQEALTNIAKHAHARNVQLEAFVDTSTIAIEITDDGCGVTPASLESRERFGVRGMRERATGMGGWIEISGVAGEGTTVMLSLPLAEDNWL